MLCRVALALALALHFPSSSSNMQQHWHCKRGEGLEATIAVGKAGTLTLHMLLNQV